MNKFFGVPGFFLTACVLLSSCLKNSETDVTLYGDAAITSFTLGSIPYTNPLTGSSSTLTGSSYKMAIDQINFRIYNPDTLPAGANVSSVLASITSLNGSGVAIRSLSDTTLYEWYSSTTAYDFSSPRHLRVFATDGTYFRDYEVNVNVRESASTTYWTAQSDTTLFGDCVSMRLFPLDTLLVALAATPAATMVCLSADQGISWVRQTQQFDASACDNAVRCGDSLFVLSNGELFFSKDAQTWESKTNSWGITQLVAAGSKELFALTADHGLKAARTDNLDTWNTEQIDPSLTASEAQQLLSLQDVRAIHFAYTALPSTDYILMVGNDGTNTVVWRKISQYANSGNTGRWVNIPAESVNAYLLPRQHPLSLVYTDGKVWATGTDTSVYQSADQGISWRINSTYALPLSMMAVMADGKGVLWAMSVNEGKGKLWRGSLY